jgi:hypothetical protein
MFDFCIARILGNDLPPRHSPGQTYTNTRFILENEPRFSGCSKEWIVNRIIDPDEEAHLLELLDKHGQTYTKLAFDLKTYRKIAEREDPKGFHRLKYLTNLNGARNMALNRGRQAARWSLPLDGNCIFTADGWDRMVRGACRTSVRYILIPMYRLLDNHDYHGFNRTNRETHEPQVAFHLLSTEMFDETRLWGGGPKLELIRRVKRNLEDVRTLGYVLRLFSGVAAGEGCYKERSALRELAVKRLLRLTERL